MESCKSLNVSNISGGVNTDEEGIKVLRTHPLRSSRHLRKNIFLSRFRSLCHLDACNLHPCPPSRRQSISTQQYHSRRLHTNLLHVHHRHPLRLFLSLAPQAHFLPRHRSSLYLRPRILLNLGYSRKNLRLRNSTPSNEICSVSYSPRPWFLHKLDRCDHHSSVVGKIELRGLFLVWRDLLAFCGCVDVEYA